MIINPIIPIWLMTIICGILIALKRKGLWPYIRQIVIVILLFAINLRIMVPDDINRESRRIDADVIFVIDSTISMVAMDYHGSSQRLEGVRNDCKKIIDKLDGARFSVISFNNTAKLDSPFTESTDFIKNSIDSIYPMSELYARGSSLNVCKEFLLNVVKSQKEKSDRKLIVFFISDGEITNGDKLSSFKGISEYIDGGAVLGYGTKSGGKMKVMDYINEEEVIIQDDSEFPSKDAVSKIDEGNLKTIASDLKTDYINMNDNGNKTDKIIEDILDDSSISTENGSTDGYSDICYIFVVPLLLMLIYEFVDLKMKGKR